MAVVVVGGSGRGVGKTALVCGVIAALPELGWTAVKVSSHAHGAVPTIYEETAGEGIAAEPRTDTARYLAAGARRAFLLTAPDSELGERLSELGALVGPDANVIFESNRVLRHLRADVCLAIEPIGSGRGKTSFALVEMEKSATVRRAGAGAERFLPGVQPAFELEDFARLPAAMQQWLRERLHWRGAG